MAWALVWSFKAGGAGSQNALLSTSNLDRQVGGHYELGGNYLEQINLELSQELLAVQTDPKLGAKAAMLVREAASRFAQIGR
jgi:demethoxyubiquinone hydroxylase (CLK1/Coq7/Cat5 family)